MTRAFKPEKNYDWGNVHEKHDWGNRSILFLGIYGVYDEYKQQKTREMTEALPQLACY